MISGSKVPSLLLVALLAAAALSLLSGLYSGLARLGYTGILPRLADDINIAYLHGPLMINTFLGTLISLERAAALQHGWTFGAPIFILIGTLTFLAGSTALGSFCLLAGSLILAAILLKLCRMQAVPHHFILLGGGLSLATGNLLLISGYPISELVLWWAAFPMLTIFGERLELNRIMRPPRRAQHLFLVLIVLWVACLVYIHINRNLAWVFGSLLLLLIALWLIRYDVARRTIKSTQWTRYSAISLLAGYIWIVITGISGLFYPLSYAGPIYDALLHMLFVGFVFSMIFAHAAIMIPSLAGRWVPWHPYFYLPLVLLHGFLGIRIIGDFIMHPVLRITGSYGNVLAILLFLGGIFYGVVIRNKN